MMQSSGSIAPPPITAERVFCAAVNAPPPHSGNGPAAVGDGDVELLPLPDPISVVMIYRAWSEGWHRPWPLIRRPEAETDGIFRKFFAEVEHWDPVYRPWLAAEATVRMWTIILTLGYVQGGSVTLESKCY